MKHPSEGQLRAYHDGALTAPERERVRGHLATCARCARTGAAVKARGARIGALLDGVAAQPARVPVSPRAARRRLDAYATRDHKESTMQRNILSRRYRPAWAAAALVLVFAISFSFAPVRALARDFLALFRVSRIQFIEVNPANMPDEESIEAALQRIETVMEDEITFEMAGPPQQVDAATASDQAGYAVRFPAALEGEPRVEVRPRIYASMQVDLPRVRTLLSELGYDHVDLPDAMDGAEVSVTFAPMVTAAYGPCQAASQDDCTLFIQMPSPEVSTPPELDIDRLGRAYLQMLGLSAEEAVRYGQQVNWTTTLVVPLPESMDLSYRDVFVDGVSGTLIRPPRYPQQYLLTWVKEGTVYALRGSGETEAVLAIAGSLP
jgi:hypothetical protein